MILHWCPAGIPRPNVIVKSIRPTTVVLTVTSSRLAEGDTLEVVNGPRTQRLLASEEEVTLSSLSPGTVYTPSFAYIRGVEKGPSVPIQVTTRQGVLQMYAWHVQCHKLHWDHV